MKLIHIADPHLGAVPDSGFPWSADRARALWQTFSQAVSRAEEEQADLLLIAGDLFHRQPLKRELKEVNALFSRLTHTRVVLIAGNHDYISASSNYRQFSWCPQVIFFRESRLQRVLFPELNTAVYGRSYHSREDTAPLYPWRPIEDDGTIRILLAHGGDEKHCPYNRKELSRAGFHYVALGHIHKPNSVFSDHVVNPGALEPIDSNDLGPHGYVIAEVTREQADIRWGPCASAGYLSLTFTVTPETTGMVLADQIRQAVARKGLNHIYKITLAGRRDPDITFSRSALDPSWRVLEFHDTTEPDYHFDQLAREHTDDLIGAYIRAFQAEQEESPSGPASSSREEEVRDKALYYGTKALLDTMKN